MTLKIPRIKSEFFQDYFIEIVKNIADTEDFIPKLEEKFSKYVGTDYAIAVSSARSGIFLILKNLKIKKRSAILPSFTVPIVPQLFQHMGFRCLFVEPEITTYNLNVGLLKKRQLEKSSIIVPTHLFGQPCEMDPITEMSSKHRMFILEDATHALGAKYKNKKIGSIGNAAVFSFGIGKIVSSFGGGMITTNDKKLAEKIRDLKKRFKNPSKVSIMKKIFKSSVVSVFTNRLLYTFTIYPLQYFMFLFGRDIVSGLFEDRQNFNELPKSYKEKMPNIQAKLILQGMKKIDRINKKRISNSRLIAKKLKDTPGIQLPEVPKHVKHVYLNYSVVVDKRKDFIKKLIHKGVDTQKTWIKNCCILGNEMKSNYPISEWLSRHLVYIPNYPQLSKRDINSITEKIRQCMGENI
jgi:dTDP-4-amino-4,6-dideoxygalactose transaminase